MSLKEIIRAVETNNYPVYTLGEKVHFVNTPNEYGETALMFVAAQGKLKLLDKLLSSGANPNAKDNYGRTALIWAIIKSQEKCAKLLIKNGADLTSRDYDQQTPALLAAANGCLDTLKAIYAKSNKAIEQKDKNGNTALHWAAQKGQIEIIKYLLKNKINLNTRNYFGATPLILAAAQGHKEIVRLLIANGADPRLTDNFDKNAFLRAKDNGHLEVSSIILEAMHGNTVSLASTNLKVRKTAKQKKSKILTR